MFLECFNLILGRWEFGWIYMRGWSGSCFQMSHFYFIGLDLGGIFLTDMLIPARADLAGVE